jgi:hypothetical protein
VRLAQLGQVDVDELAALRERAHEAKLRVGTGRERLSDGVSLDARNVDFHEAA